MVLSRLGLQGRGVVAAGTEVALIPPEIWAASVAVFSQDLSVPDPVLNCSVEWLEAGGSGWDTNSACSSAC